MSLIMGKRLLTIVFTSSIIANLIFPSNDSDAVVLLKFNWPVSLIWILSLNVNLKGKISRGGFLLILSIETRFRF